MVAVSGTAPIGDDGKTVGVGDAYTQTLRCLEIIEKALQTVGASMSDVIRTRVFLTDIGVWQDAAKAHGKVFADILPACTFAEVSALINDKWLVEIEADAVVG